MCFKFTYHLDANSNKYSFSDLQIKNTNSIGTERLICVSDDLCLRFCNINSLLMVFMLNIRTIGHMTSIPDDLALRFL